jgi:hypothetical protein
MGKPTTSVVSYSELSSCWKRTRGTETSKYPQEKKSIEIPPVVASEKGISLNH